MILVIVIIALVCFEAVMVVNILTEKRKFKLKDYLAVIFGGLIFLIFLRIFCGI